MIEHYIVRWNRRHSRRHLFRRRNRARAWRRAGARSPIVAPRCCPFGVRGEPRGKSTLEFLLGRHGGRLALAHRLRWQTQATRVNHWITRYGTTFVAGFRFIYGLRSVSLLILGASGYPPLRFLWLNIAGAALWAMCFSALGWGLSAGSFAHSAVTSNGLGWGSVVLSSSPSLRCAAGSCAAARGDRVNLISDELLPLFRGSLVGLAMTR